MPSATARADGNLHNVNHIIVVMQENRSFDHYFGALPYVPGGPYHGGFCSKNDHRCVDGLSCWVDPHGAFHCWNSNRDDDGSIVRSFHEQSYCVGPDLDHSWKGSHKELNFEHPAATLRSSPGDGFVLQNDAATTEGQPDNGVETPTDDDTMGFYTQDDLPFYYSLAQTFAIDDRYFCSVIGQTFPNRSYLLAATSFGHLSTAEIFPPPGGYKPVTGTIMDLLDQNNVSWVDYFAEVPQTISFRPSDFPFVTPHTQPISEFVKAAAAGTLPSVSFVDPIFGIIFGGAAENDEHPPTDVRKGEAFVSTVVNAVRNGPSWKDSIIFIVYDEHGGFYDHVAPARAPQGRDRGDDDRGPHDSARNPDGIDPGQCADLSNPPASTLPGGGVECDTVSPAEALAICPTFTPQGPYPRDCANFDQLGVRVPFIAVSPFSKPHYVSHTVGDHTSILALIEKRFMSNNKGNGNSHVQHLTARDGNADPLEDMFNFSHPPSMDAVIPTAPGASPTDPGCPFVPPGT
jgi:phospholipase C